MVRLLTERVASFNQSLTHPSETEMHIQELTSHAIGRWLLL